MTGHLFDISGQLWPDETRVWMCLFRDAVMSSVSLPSERNDSYLVHKFAIKLFFYSSENVNNIIIWLICNLMRINEHRILHHGRVVLVTAR